MGQLYTPPAAAAHGDGAMMHAIEVARRLELRRYPRSWRGRCPACDYPGTFSVRARRNGCALLFCASYQDRDALAEAVARAIGHDTLADCYLIARRK